MMKYPKYLKYKQDSEEKDRCCICNKHIKELRNWKRDWNNRSILSGQVIPDGVSERFMTYELPKPVCIYCFMNIKYNKKLLLQIMASNNKYHFGSWDYELLKPYKVYRPVNECIEYVPE